MASMTHTFIGMIDLTMLIVAGVVTLMVMFMSVSERTKEFGMLRAIGARRSRILTLVLEEAVIVCIAGSVLGILLSFLMMKVMFGGTLFSLETTVRAVIFMTVIGVIAGLIRRLNQLRYSRWRRFAMSETVRAIEISRPSNAAVVAETTAVVLETAGMKKSYKMGNVTVEALKGVDISVRQGEFVAIIGPSGSGKSTLLNLVGCLDRPTDGKVLIDGIDVSKMNDAKLTDIRCRKIGYVFQKFYLLPFLTALENVELQARLAGLPDGKKKAADAFRLVGLTNA
jgi:ABC-type multidrug transport system fused ATPase/permease subunit